MSSVFAETDHRAPGPSYLRGIPAAEWVRRLDQIPHAPLRGALANVIDWDFFLHLPVKHATLKTPSYTQLVLWAAPYPAGGIPEKELEQGLLAIGYMAGDANRRAFGDWEKKQWNPYVPLKGEEVAS